MYFKQFSFHLKFGFISAVCTEFGLKFVMISQCYISSVRRLHISPLLSNKNRENSKVNYVNNYVLHINYVMNAINTYLLKNLRKTNYEYLVMQSCLKLGKYILYKYLLMLQGKENIQYAKYRRPVFLLMRDCRRAFAVCKKKSLGTQSH